VSGFLEEKLGEALPPATHYRLVSAETGFYAEFVTPFEGNEYKRSRQWDATTRIAGVSFSETQAYCFAAQKSVGS
jgi:hypothetical protein